MMNEEFKLVGAYVKYNAHAFYVRPVCQDAEGKLYYSLSGTAFYFDLRSLEGNGFEEEGYIFQKFEVAADE